MIQSDSVLKGLPRQLAYHMRHGDWIHKGVLTADMEWRHLSGKKIGSRYLPETVGRALRHLEEDCVIAVKQAGVSVQYKHIPEGERRQRYITSSCRPKGQEDVLFREVTT